MPACPKPTLLTWLVPWHLNYVVVASIPRFTVGVACNGWPPAPTSSPPRPISTGLSAPPRSRPGSNIKTPPPPAFDRPRREAPTLRLSKKKARAKQNYQGGD